MELEQYITEIVNTCEQSPSKEVLDRMLERDSPVRWQLRHILEKIEEEAKEEYRKQIVHSWTSALAPFTQGMIEKLAPKPNPVRVAYPSPATPPPAQPIPYFPPGQHQIQV